jgi:hypothetical protein
MAFASHSIMTPLRKLHLIAYDIFGNPKVINLSAKAYFSILHNARGWK